MVKTLVVGKIIADAHELACELGVAGVDAFVTSPRSIKAGAARGLSGVQRVFVDRAVLTDDIAAALAPLVAFTGGHMYSVARIL